MKAKKIVEFSHREAGYEKTSQGEVISYSWAEHLRPQDFDLETPVLSNS